MLYSEKKPTYIKKSSPALWGGILLCLTLSTPAISDDSLTLSVGYLPWIALEDDIDASEWLPNRYDAFDLGISYGKTLYLVQGKTAGVYFQYLSYYGRKELHLVHQNPFHSASVGFHLTRYTMLNEEIRGYMRYRIGLGLGQFKIDQRHQMGLLEFGTDAGITINDAVNLGFGIAIQGLGEPTETKASAFLIQLNAGFRF